MGLCKLIKVEVVATCDYCFTTKKFSTEAGWRVHYSKPRNPEFSDLLFCKGKRCYMRYKSSKRYSLIQEGMHNGG